MTAYFLNFTTFDLQVWPSFLPPYENTYTSLVLTILEIYVALSYYLLDLEIFKPHHHPRRNSFTAWLSLACGHLITASLVALPFVYQESVGSIRKGQWNFVVFGIFATLAGGFKPWYQATN